jgi:membrane associated rhomboid family serine protease
MIPIKDDVVCKRTPFVNYLFMILCTAVFALQVSTGAGNSHVVERMGMVPARIAAEPGEEILVPTRVAIQTPFGIRVVEAERPLVPAAVPEWLTLVTCIFLHGGWLHFLGNMWFLWIFGDNVEDRLGHATFAVLYLGTGVVAGLAHMVFNFSSPIPTIGASGAIAGVMGAYLWMFPRAQVLTIIPLLFFWPLLILPAPIFLGIWFIMQFWSGALAVTSEATAGVAWWAHIGGFVAGLACAAALGVEPPAAEAVGEQGEAPASSTKV